MNLSEELLVRRKAVARLGRLAIKCWTASARHNCRLDTEATGSKLSTWLAQRGWDARKATNK